MRFIFIRERFSIIPFFMMNLHALTYRTIITGKCSFKEKYNLYCPGCGATRALNKLLHLQIISSFLSNPIVVVSVIIMLFFLLLRIFENKKGQRKHRNYKIRLIALIGMLLFWTLFAVLRNLLLVYFGYDYLGDIL